MARFSYRQLWELPHYLSRKQCLEKAADLISFNMYYLSENNAPIIALKRVFFENDLEGIKEIIGLNRLNRSQDKKSNILRSVHL